MQKKTIGVLLLVFIFINSCKTDFDIIAPYKETTVVYGLIDPNPNVKYQYIKINKAFLGEGNALIMAQQKDSINYTPGTLDVTLQQVNPDNTVVTYQFEAIDTVPKDPGIFSNPYQVLYINKGPLPIVQDGSSTYNLVIYNKSDKQTLSASTSVVQAMDSSFFSNPSQSPNGQVKFTGVSDSQFTVLFNAAKNARLYSLVIRLHYLEKNIATGDSSAKFISWDQGTQKSIHLDGSDQITFVFNRTDFYGFVRNQLSVDNNLRRYVSATKQIDFIVTYAGDDLSTYIDVNQPSIGIIQERPEYSNIKNGIGIFSSRSSITLTRSMDIASYDTLLVGSVTGVLNLQKD